MIAVGVILAAVGGCASGGQTPAAPTAVTPPNQTPAQPPATQQPLAPATRPEGIHTTSAAWSSDDAVVATVAGRNILMGDLLKPLLEAHGLNTLLALVQLELAKQNVEKQNIVVTPQDIQTERQRLMGELFHDFDEQIDEKIEQARKKNQTAEAQRLQKEKQDGHDQLLDRFLNEKRITPGEFDILIQTKTYLRKLAVPLVEGKITEEMLRTQFAVRYGERVQVRHIQLARPQDVWEAKRRLQAGQKFEDVARAMSTNRQTAALGGELPPFSREDTTIPQAFKDAAFALKPGEVSEMVQAGNAYHLIKLDERIMPKAVKFETERDAIKRDLREAYIEAVSKRLGEQIGQTVRQELQIKNPILARQFAERMEKFNAELTRQETADKMEQERHRIAAQNAAINRAADARAATQPGATQPGATPPGATQPAAIEPGETPPAAHPGATTRPGTGAAPSFSIEQRIQSLSPATRPSLAPHQAAATSPAGPATRPAGDHQ